MAITNGYTTLASAKTLLGVTLTTHEADLERAIEAASRTIDQVAGRRFYADGSATARIYTPDHPKTLFVDDISTTTGLVVASETTYGTWGQSWTINDWTGSYGFRVEPADYGAPYWRLEALSGVWPETRHSVSVTATWGYPSVPTEIAQACLLLATRYYKRKDTPFGLLDNPNAGATALPKTDPDVYGLVMRHRRYADTSR